MRKTITLLAAIALVMTISGCESFVEGFREGYNGTASTKSDQQNNSSTSPSPLETQGAQNNGNSSAATQINESEKVLEDASAFEYEYSIPLDEIEQRNSRAFGW